MTTVREATFDVLRDHGMHRVFANPGSTEVALLGDLPDDLELVLALHEGSVVGLATGHAIATGTPALALLHTTAGYGNAVGAIATARVTRVPLVVLVGQQDRRHLALEPFLAGALDRLADPYPVWTAAPTLPQDVPAAVRRAWHEASQRRGPAVVIVPMDDWAAAMAPDLGLAAPLEVEVGTRTSDEGARRVAELLAGSRRPVVVVGAGADDAGTWDALTTLAERLGCPVWQEPFGARAGFPQDHRLFAGHLPASRARVRAALDGHDAVLVVGTSALRQYPFEPGPLVPEGARVAVVSEVVEEVDRSAAHLGVLAAPGPLCRAVAKLVPDRTAGSDDAPRASSAAARPTPPGPGEPLRAGHVLSALADRLPADAVVVEETPSSRPELHRLLPARAPGGFLSAAMGGLGFGLPAAVGRRMADPSRPVVAVLGDGSALYGIHGLWSAAHYGVGVLLVVLSNGRYAVMDRLAEQQHVTAPWPAFTEIDVAGLARAQGCPATRVGDHAQLVAALDALVPALRDATAPHLLDVAVVPDPTFAP